MYGVREGARATRELYRTDDNRFSVGLYRTDNNRFSVGLYKTNDNRFNGCRKLNLEQGQQR